MIERLVVVTSHRLDEIVPFLGNGHVAWRDRLSGAGIPICGIREVAFLAVKMRVNPRAGFSLDVLLAEVMRVIPFAGPCHPERL